MQEIRSGLFDVFLQTSEVIHELGGGDATRPAPELGCYAELHERLLALVDPEPE